MKALNIIETAYRATLEEQDDPIVWITHAMKGAGADLDVVLRGNAVNYAVEKQEVAALSFGDKTQKHPANLARDIKGLMDKGINVYIVEEDVSERGLERQDLMSGLKPVPRSGVPKIMKDYDHIWHW